MGKGIEGTKITYTFSKSSSSILTQCTELTIGSNKYQFVKLIHEGEGRVVFLYSDGASKLAVKEVYSNSNDAYERARKECENFNLAYPSLDVHLHKGIKRYGGFASVFLVVTTYLNENLDYYLTANKLVLLRLRTANKRLVKNSLYQLLINICNELMRLQALNIIIGDVHSGNILLRNGSISEIYFIDMCPLTSKANNGNIADLLKSDRLRFFRMCRNQYFADEFCQLLDANEREQLFPVLKFNDPDPKALVTVLQGLLANLPQLDSETDPTINALRQALKLDTATTDFVFLCAGDVREDTAELDAAVSDDDAEPKDTDKFLDRGKAGRFRRNGQAGSSMGTSSTSLSLFGRRREGDTQPYTRLPSDVDDNLRANARGDGYYTLDIEDDRAETDDSKKCCGCVIL